MLRWKIIDTLHHKSYNSQILITHASDDVKRSKYCTIKTKTSWTAGNTKIQHYKCYEQLTVGFLITQNQDMTETQQIKQVVRPPQYPPPPEGGDLKSNPRVAWWPWPLTLEVVQNVDCGMDKLPANFGASVTFRRRVMGKRASDWRHDLITLTFDVTTDTGDAGHRTPSLDRV